jgi:hypothetical protein
MHFETLLEAPAQIQTLNEIIRSETIFQQSTSVSAGFRPSAVFSNTSRDPNGGRDKV